MQQQFAEAQYQGPFNPPEDDYLAWNTIAIPADRTTVEGVASYLRFASRCSDCSLMQFVWQGQRYDPMGQQLSATPE